MGESVSGEARFLAFAALGLALEARRRSVRAAGAVADRTVRPVADGLLRRAASEGRLAAWSERGQAHWSRAEERAAVVVGALPQRIADALLDRIDLDAVADRVDPNRVAERVDLDALITRVDLTARTNEVLAEIDVPRLVRESGGSMATETIEAFREQNVRADRFVDRFVARLLARGDDGDGDAGPPAPTA